VRWVPDVLHDADDTLHAGGGRRRTSRGGTIGLSEAHPTWSCVEQESESLAGGVVLVGPVNGSLPEIEPVVVDLEAKARHLLSARVCRERSKKDERGNEVVSHFRYASVAALFGQAERLGTGIGTDWAPDTESPRTPRTTEQQKLPFYIKRINGSGTENQNYGFLILNDATTALWICERRPVGAAVKKRKICISVVP